MDLLHTKEEIKALYELNKKVVEINKLGEIYKDSMLIGYAESLSLKIKKELDLYNQLIGTEALSPKAMCRQTPKLGHIESISHFIWDDVMVKFRYGDRGFDHLRLSELLSE